jgi:hypothetical protein
MGRHSKPDHPGCRTRMNPSTGVVECLDFHCPGCGERVAPQVIPSEHCPHCNQSLKGIDRDTNTPSAD